MFHGCALRGVPIIFFCIVFIVCLAVLLGHIIVISIQNRNNHLEFKRIIKIAFSDALDAGLDMGLYILAGIFIVMVIAVPISYSKEHALEEAQFYYERCITLSKKINEVNKNKENIPEELKSYDIILIDKKTEMYEEAKRRLDYWHDRIND